MPMLDGSSGHSARLGWKRQKRCILYKLALSQLSRVLVFSDDLYLLFCKDYHAVGSSLRWSSW
jgi:hypothetical protein